MRPLLACLVSVIPAQAGTQTIAHHAARKISASESATFSVESDFFLTESESVCHYVLVMGILARPQPARRVRGCLKCL
jgi:hypothetical protein